MHDIGVLLVEDAAESHAIAGAKLIKKCGESSIVVNAVAAHHKEVQAESFYATLVMIADSIFKHTVMCGDLINRWFFAKGKKY